MNENNNDIKWYISEGLRFESCRLSKWYDKEDNVLFGSSMDIYINACTLVRHTLIRCPFKGNDCIFYRLFRRFIYNGQLTHLIFNWLKSLHSYGESDIRDRSSWTPNHRRIGLVRDWTLFNRTLY